MSSVLSKHKTVVPQLWKDLNGQIPDSHSQFTSQILAPPLLSICSSQARLVLNSGEGLSDLMRMKCGPRSLAQIPSYVSKARAGLTCRGRCRLWCAVWHAWCARGRL